MRKSRARRLFQIANDVDALPDEALPLAETGSLRPTQAVTALRYYVQWPAGNRRPVVQGAAFRDSHPAGLRTAGDAPHREREHSFGCIDRLECRITALSMA